MYLKYSVEVMSGTGQKIAQGTKKPGLKVSIEISADGEICICPLLSIFYIFHQALKFYHYIYVYKMCGTSFLPHLNSNLEQKQCRLNKHEVRLHTARAILTAN